MSANKQLLVCIATQTLENSAEVTFFDTWLMADFLTKLAQSQMPHQYFAVLNSTMILFVEHDRDRVGW